MLTKPRAACFCQSVAATLSANVAPPGALNQRDDLSFPVSAVRFGFAGRLLSALCFLLAIGLLWPPCACASPREHLDSAFSPRRLCSCSSVSPGPGCGRHIHHPGSEKLQPESLVIKPTGGFRVAVERNWGGGFLSNTR